MTRLAFIGAGRVGTAMALLLRDAGYDVVGMASREPEKAWAAAERIGCPVLSPAAAAQAADWLCIATTDDALKFVTEQLATSGALASVQVAVHFSGVWPASVLHHPEARHLQAVSVHPLASMPTVEAALGQLRRCWYGLDGDEPACTEARQMIERIGGRCIAVPAEARALYHAAACTSSNYLCTLLHIASRMMLRVGVPPDQAVTALLPLMEGTLENLQNRGLPAALTGPIARGDVETVRRHLEALAEQAPHWLDIYRELGRHTLDLAPQDAIARVLEDWEE
ncbi:MAG: Rossmann-like and DUF2520 domain-containing protein [Candidatus Xenobia bacterium]